MADQRKWFKVWASILTDPKFLNMNLEDIGRWALLGAMICQQGTKGKIQINPPSEVLVLRFKVADFSGLKEAVKGLPNVHLTECFPANDGFIVTFLNWYKYQVDSTVAKRVTSLRRKKRGEETLTAKTTSPSPRASRAPAFGAGDATRETSTTEPGGNDHVGNEKSGGTSIFEQIAKRRRAQGLEKL